MCVSSGDIGSCISWVWT